MAASIFEDTKNTDERCLVFMSKVSCIINFDHVKHMLSLSSCIGTYQVEGVFYFPKLI